LVAALLMVAQAQDDKEYQTVRMVALGDYKVKVFCEPVRQEILQRQQYWGGGGRTLPELRVARMVMSRRNQEIYVPRSVYADLSNINRMWLENLKHGVKLRIEGGDAHAGYEAAVTLFKDKVASRIVRSGEFPQYEWERTSYSLEAIPADL
jgi:hypothetical protein